MHPVILSVILCVQPGAQTLRRSLSLVAHSRRESRNLMGSTSQVGRQRVKTVTICANGSPHRRVR